MFNVYVHYTWSYSIAMLNYRTVPQHTSGDVDLCQVVRWRQLGVWVRGKKEIEEEEDEGSEDEQALWLLFGAKYLSVIKQYQTWLAGKFL